MEKSEAVERANSVLQTLRDQGLSDADCRKVLGAARSFVKRPRSAHVPDSEICVHFQPGAVVRPRALAAEIGCTAKRVRELLFAACSPVEIVRGIFQIPV